MPGDRHEQNSRLNQARQHFHPAIKRSGMRFKRNSASCPASNPNGTIKFGASYGKSIQKNAKKDKSAQQMLEKISSRKEVDEKDQEESKHR